MCVSVSGQKACDYSKVLEFTSVFKSNKSSHRKATTLRRDLHATSPQNIHTLLRKQVIRILKFIRYKLFF